jgi:hypothetical protein
VRQRTDRAPLPANNGAMNNTVPPMKHIFDSSFRYEPSFDTNIRKTGSTCCASTA